MSEQKHWIEDDTTRKKFWAYAKGDLGLCEIEVHQALGIEHTKDFDGDKAGAMTLLQNYAAGIVPCRVRAELSPQEPAHAEARVIAFCDLYAPSGTRISLTAREGTMHDELVATTLALVDATETLVNVFGFSAVPQKYTPGNRQPAAKSPAPPTPPTPPSTPGSAPPPPPAQPPIPPAGNGQPQSGIIQAEFVRITAPKGKPVVEFWRPNRKYAEIRWSLGGAKLLAIAPTLVAAKWQVVHFDAGSVGQEYQLLVNVHWTASKCGKYKDIIKVELRRE